MVHDSCSGFQNLKKLNNRNGNKFAMSRVDLCEASEDIHGASLNGKDISKLTVSELKSIATIIDTHGPRFHV